MEGGKINVLMFGWELPPYNSGGLGTACLGMTESLAPLGISINFVVPKLHGPLPYNHMNVHSAADYSTVEEIEKLLNLSREEQRTIAQAIAYGGQVSMSTKDRELRITQGVGGLAVAPADQADWYAYQATAIAQKQQFDIVHCHDWMTMHCGIAAKEVAAARGEDVSFIAHVHITAIDQAGGNPKNADPRIMAIEKRGMEAADRVIAVSEYTRQMIHRHYQIPLNKITVVHNGIPRRTIPTYDLPELKKHHKIVLYLGRITVQKGPDYFIQLAKAVTDQDPSVRFVMVGSGDMERQCIEQAARTGLTGKVLFSRFLRGQAAVDRAYVLADLFVMPSASEPFGLVALEAMQMGTPVLVSKQSGVSEVTDAIIAADFWDVAKMSEHVLDILQHPEKQARLSKEGKLAAEQLSWEGAAEKIQAVYRQLFPGMLTLAPQHA
jgi:glycogen synthase